MWLCNPKLIYLSAFEQFWASTGHKLLTKCEYPTSVPARVKLGQMSSIAAKPYSFEAQWRSVKARKRDGAAFHWFKTHAAQDGKHRYTWHF